MTGSGKKWFEQEFSFLQKYVRDHYAKLPYSSHHLDHTIRVRDTALKIGLELGAAPEVIIPAALLHDLERGNEAGRGCHARLAEGRARRLLERRGWPSDLLEDICRAIVEHRFSSNIVPESLEGRILQDSDRLDALGAIGILRVVLHTSTHLLYCLEEPFPKTRKPDHSHYTLDHFHKKILFLKDSLHTEPARRIASWRHDFVVGFLGELNLELTGEK